MRRVHLLVFGAVLLTAACRASAATIIGVSWEGEVVSVDGTSGAQSSIGSSGFTGLNSLARNSAGTFISVAGHPLFTSTSTLISLNPSTGLGTSLGTVSGLPAGTVRALAFAPDDTL